MSDKTSVVQELVRKGEETYRGMPKASQLPHGKSALTESFVVSAPAMTTAAAQIGLNPSAVLGMIDGQAWEGISLKPIDAALIAPAFEADAQKQIAAALEDAQRKFWESQHFYLDEMAGVQASAIPNVFMRDTLLAMENRAVFRLTEKLRDGAATPIVWIDFAAGPATFVNGALHRLRNQGADLGRLRIILVEPSRPFLEYARQQPILRELESQQHLFAVDGILEDGTTYQKIADILAANHLTKADLITQAFGASYVADHLREAMWRAMFDTAHPSALKAVIAATTKYKPNRMIMDRLKDELKKRKENPRNSGTKPSTLAVFFPSLGTWISAFARRVPVDTAGKTQPALVALINYGRGIRKYCPIRLSGEGFEQEIERATAQKVAQVIPVLDEQAVLLEL